VSDRQRTVRSPVTTILDSRQVWAIRRQSWGDPEVMLTIPEALDFVTWIYD